MLLFPTQVLPLFCLILGISGPKTSQQFGGQIKPHFHLPPFMYTLVCFYHLHQLTFYSCFSSFKTLVKFSTCACLLFLIILCDMALYILKIILMVFQERMEINARGQSILDCKSGHLKKLFLFK